MRHRGLFLALCGMIIAIAYQSVARSQDKVDRRDKKATDKTVIMSGQITDESVAGIKLKIGLKEELIPPGDIVRVFYNELPAQAKLAFNNIFIAEEKEKDLGKLLKSYKDFAPQVNTAAAGPKRYVQFRIAMLTAAVAQSDAEKDDAKKLLQDFTTVHVNSWEYPLAARQLARLLIDRGEFEQASRVLEGLAGKPGVPPDIKAEADNLLIDALFQANELDKVKTRIEAAKTAPGVTEVQKSRLSIYEIACESTGDFKIEDLVKKLEDAINRSTDNSVKALAYNVMGDLFLKKGKKRDAMWAWLWVDVVYNQDEGEHSKAMSRLLRYFKEEQDAEKALFYEEKLRRAR